MKKILILFIFIFLFRVFNSLYMYLKARRIKNLYIDSFIEGSGTNITSYKADLKYLVKNANVNYRIGAVQPLGFGQIMNGEIDLCDNLGNRREDVVSNTMIMLDTLISTFKFRFLSSFNPLYWINSIMFLPRNLLTSLGLNDESKLIKIIQPLYWLIMFIVWLFNDELIQLFRDFLSKLFK